MRSATDAALVAGGALVLDGAARAGRCPVTLDRLTSIGGHRAVRQPFACRTLVFVVLFDVLERGPIEQALGLVG